MVTVASDIAEARQRIIDKLEPKDTKETKEPGIQIVAREKSLKFIPQPQLLASVQILNFGCHWGLLLQVS